MVYVWQEFKIYKWAISELPFTSALKRVLVKNLSYENKFSYQWCRTKTRFDTEEKLNWEKAYSVGGVRGYGTPGLETRGRGLRGRARFLNTPQ